MSNKKEAEQQQQPSIADLSKHQFQQRMKRFNSQLPF
jgi:hypothetical protein